MGNNLDQPVRQMCPPEDAFTSIYRCRFLINRPHYNPRVIAAVPTGLGKAVLRRLNDAKRFYRYVHDIRLRRSLGHSVSDVVMMLQGDIGFFVDPTVPRSTEVSYTHQSSSIMPELSEKVDLMSRIPETPPMGLVDFYAVVCQTPEPGFEDDDDAADLKTMIEALKLGVMSDVMLLKKQPKHFNQPHYRTQELCDELRDAVSEFTGSLAASCDSQGDFFRVQMYCVRDTYHFVLNSSNKAAYEKHLGQYVTADPPVFCAEYWDDAIYPNEQIDHCVRHIRDSTGESDISFAVTDTNALHVEDEEQNGEENASPRQCAKPLVRGSC
eukprot:TRINITY_DN7103_c0_g1_i1.p1 TRINITY_DN7103_c0_g1~~TRINITY_DN7103_c0_g1_i1.p1  ORF type:complete len:325 (+),score=53.62 TRINITY_DN7103_c0_g1_i1:628-1602(+)